MKVVTFSIFKGGTAKTTSTVNTAAALVSKGKKVLVIDLDQQASATRYLDLDPDASPRATLLTFLTHGFSIQAHKLFRVRGIPTPISPTTSTIASTPIFWARPPMHLLLTLLQSSLGDSLETSVPSGLVTQKADNQNAGFY